jgi:hypothetical protein
MSFADYLVGAYLGPVLAVVPYSLTLFAVSRTWKASNLPAFALEIAVSLAVFLPAAYFLAFNRIERAHWMGRLRPATQLANEVS